MENKDKLCFKIGMNTIFVTVTSLIILALIFLLLWRIFHVNTKICLLVIIIVYYILNLKFVFTISFYDNYFVINYPLRFNLLTKSKIFHYYNEIRLIQFNWDINIPNNFPELDIFFHKKKYPIFLISYSLDTINELLEFIEEKGININRNSSLNNF